MDFNQIFLLWQSLVLKKSIQLAEVTSTSALNQQNLETRQATSTYTMAQHVAPALDVSASAYTNCIG